ncbi:hypothetical protein [Elioraea sp.]|uniref:hypothetical protein n=1 Tax=Elioraea sp. TaxID=2185103 RepID=UPI0025C7088C|nr:hypothetical protein [Elioraea sp.]
MTAPGNTRPALPRTVREDDDVGVIVRAVGAQGEQTAARLAEEADRQRVAAEQIERVKRLEAFVAQQAGIVRARISDFRKDVRAAESMTCRRCPWPGAIRRGETPPASG